MFPYSTYHQGQPRRRQGLDFVALRPSQDNAPFTASIIPVLRLECIQPFSECSLNNTSKFKERLRRVQVISRGGNPQYREFYPAPEHPERGALSDFPWKDINPVSQKITGYRREGKPVAMSARIAVIIGVAQPTKEESAMSATAFYLWCSESTVTAAVTGAVTASSWCIYRCNCTAFTRGYRRSFVMHY
ncbi:hypothetical protein J6590_067180 [Homalodisca vitripennis]|nr:hypothetical protein J6590_067180 [Homalodisca vitripennis]